MPQKRNPWNCEHVKSMWKAFSPMAATFFMDQISEHQRDLSNSASKRFVCEYVAGFAMAVSRMSDIIAGLQIHRERMLANLRSAGGSILAEPAYILLAESGVDGAHEVIRRLTLESEKNGNDFADTLIADGKTFSSIADVMVKKHLAADKEAAKEWFRHPERYTGLAAKKAKALAKKYSSV
jgi:adenylosuccinate lyase